MLADDDFVEHEDVEPEDAEPEVPEELGEGSLGELLTLPSQIPSALCVPVCPCPSHGVGGCCPLTLVTPFSHRAP